MEQISQLLFKYVKGTLQPDEAVRLEKWANTDPVNREILEKLGKDEDLLADIKKWYAIPVRSLSDDKRLYMEIVKHERRSLRHNLSRWLPYTAAALFVLTIGYFFLDQGQRSKEQELAVADILPGSNRATLILSDGQEVALSEGQEGIVIKDDITYGDGSHVMDDKHISGDLTDSPTLYYQLSTPKGGTYQVTLPDGSKIWLNASSRLRYPTKFESGERIVELEGEAYFEISKSMDQPFKVVSNNQIVEVLGTAFNIAAYPEEETKTTLVTGIVQVASHQTKEVSKLIPGQQAIIRGAAIAIHQVDVRQYTGWKDGKIVLEGRTLPEILSEVSRWYDIEIRYEGAIPQGTFFGRIDRNSRLETVLRLLESANMDYQMEGRTLIVKARRN